MYDPNGLEVLEYFPLVHRYALKLHPALLSERRSTGLLKKTVSDTNQNPAFMMWQFVAFEEFGVSIEIAAWKCYLTKAKTRSISL
jgi:hypothetical protein